MGYEGRMIRIDKLRAAAAVMLLGGPLPAAADTAQSIDYRYYTVSGRTPAEIYRSILDRGPRVAGEKAIATTTARAIQNYSLAQQGSSCRVTDNQLSFRFTVQLPRPTNISALSPQDRALWQQFTAFLKAHELQHTKLWLRCGAALDRKVLSIKTGSCKAAAQEAEELWGKLKVNCDKQQTSFDREQRSELAAQPFMQRVMRGD